MRFQQTHKLHTVLHLFIEIKTLGSLKVKAAIIQKPVH